MAFNPLHWMRKHQKVMMAGLVIMIMFIFILSGGSAGGDFFDWLRNAVTSRGQNTEVGTLYGERIDTQEYARLRRQRMVAHQYMAIANMEALSQVEEQTKRLSEEMKKAKAGGENVFQQQAALQGMLGKLRQRQPQRGQLYFGGGLAPEDIFDFLIWKRQADRLGIQLTEAGIRRERNQELIVELSRERLAAIERAVAASDRGDRGERLTGDQLATALADEFRVRLAKASLLGPDAPAPRQNQFGMSMDPSSGRLQTSFTPHEYWEFYRKGRTEISVRLLPVAARDLVPQVKDPPDEKELRELFDKYKEAEPNPALKTPGFKQPRRVQIEWVSANPADAPYPRAAEVSLAVLEATMPVVFQNQLLTEYNHQKFRFRLPSWTEEQSGKALLPALKQPDFELVRRLHGLPVGSLGSAIVSAAAGAYQAREVALDLKELGGWVDEETKKRQQLLASTLALAAVPSPYALLAGAPPLGVVARQHAGDPFGQHLPLAVVKRYLFKNLREETARGLVRSNLETFRKELEKRRSRPDDLKKYLAEVMPRFGLKTGAMAQPRDQHTLFEDPAMQPLRESLKETFRFMAQFQGPRELAALLDDDPKGRVLSTFFFSSLTKLYTPQDTVGRGETTYVYWMTSDKPAAVAKFEEVKDQVVEAWRLDKARELAKKEAEQVAEAARKAGNDALRVLIDGSPHSDKRIDLYGVTRLKPPEQSPLPGRDRQYTPYRLPRGDIEFPTPDFVDKLLDLKDFDNVAVLHDLPESTYYVAVPLSRRTEPLPGEFNAIYKRSSPAEFMPDPLLAQFDQSRRAEQQRALMDQLRAEAKLTLNADGVKAVADER